METKIEFLFRNKTYSALVFFSFEESPFYIFVIIKDKELIQEFGEEITITTDCENAISKKDDEPTLRQLRELIFLAMKNTQPFLLAKQKANC